METKTNISNTPKQYLWISLGLSICLIVSHLLIGLNQVVASQENVTQNIETEMGEGFETIDQINQKGQEKVDVITDQFSSMYGLNKSESQIKSEEQEKRDAFREDVDNREREYYENKDK